MLVFSWQLGQHLFKRRLNWQLYEITWSPLMAQILLDTSPSTAHGRSFVFPKALWPRGNVLMSKCDVYHKRGTAVDNPAWRLKLILFWSRYINTYYKVGISCYVRSEIWYWFMSGLYHIHTQSLMVDWESTSMRLNEDY